MRFGELLQGLIETRLREQQKRVIVVGNRVAGVQLDRLLQFGLALLPVPLIENVDVAKGGMGFPRLPSSASALIAAASAFGIASRGGM